ncbi:MAG: hypothetical protein RL095_1046 [Verrucomicrobiota bacterium]|jgi:hypothetical protein
MESPKIPFDPATAQAPASWKGLSILLGLVGAGLAAGAWFTKSSETRFAHAYLVGFMLVALIGTGALMFVMLQQLSRAGWSVSSRRIAEGWISSLFLLVLLFIPLVLLAKGGHLYAWMDGFGAAAVKNAGNIPDADRLAAHVHHMSEKKAFWLNESSWLARSAFYLVAWVILAALILRRSFATDGANKEDAAKHTTFIGTLSAPGVPLLGLTLTFACFDWVMSLQFDWYSTIFGVIHFADSMVLIASLMIISIAVFQGKGLMKGAVNVEHKHDLAKWLFAFNTFFAFVSYAQFIIIWFADIPEETVWYHRHADDGWGLLGWITLFGHFFVIFFLLMSRHMKRNQFVTVLVSVFAVLMAIVHLFWEIMPTMGYPVPHAAGAFSVQAADILVIVGLLTMSVAAFLFTLSGRNLVSVGDPRLQESLKFENY